jgi:hypothetical protein
MRASFWQSAVFLVLLIGALVLGAVWFTPKMAVGYILIGVILLGTTIAILSIRDILATSKWSLADALSEQSTVTVDDPANPGQKIIRSDSKSSMSRLIAMMGMMAILILYICIGCACVWSLTQDGKFPESALQGAAFLTSGVSLFIPYVVNKAASG